MATTTPNLGLVKPDYEDLADIEVINENMDTIDAAVKAVQDSVSAISTTTTIADISTLAVAKSNFTISSITYRKYGHVIQLNVAVVAANALSANANYETLTMNTGYRPKSHMVMSSTTIADDVKAVLGTSGVLTIRPGVAFSAGKSFSLMGTFVV